MQWAKTKPAATAPGDHLIVSILSPGPIPLPEGLPIAEDYTKMDIEITDLCMFLYSKETGLSVSQFFHEDQTEFRLLVGEKVNNKRKVDALVRITFRHAQG